jgi:hypothetical protein
MLMRMEFEETDSFWGEETVFVYGVLLLGPVVKLASKRRKSK